MAAGVSPLAALNALVSAGAWFAYGLSAGLPVVWGVSIAAMVPGVWTVVLLRRDTTRSDLLGASSFVAVLCASAAVGRFSLALAVGVLIISGPQVWRAVTQRDLRGIAPATWWVALADATSWGAYGLVVDDPALKGYAIVLFASAVVVLARLRWVQMAAAV